MGHGEWYLWMWSAWWQTLDEAAQASYLVTWTPKIPPEWAGWLPS
jgi:hypothetical protein